MPPGSFCNEQKQQAKLRLNLVKPRKNGYQKGAGEQLRLNLATFFFTCIYVSDLDSRFCTLHLWVYDI